MWFALRATGVLDVRLALARSYTTRLRHGNCFFSRGEERGTRVDHLEHRRQTDDGREAAGALEARFFGPLGQEIPERILDRGR